jgi:hypothetical protein
LAQVPVGEAARLEGEDHHGSQERLDAPVAEAQACRSALG